VSAVTEDEAKTKWCPKYGTEDASCCASRCMWWRWISKTGTSEDGKPNYYTGKWKGYCGPAGKP